MRVLKPLPEHVHEWVDMAESFNRQALVEKGHHWDFKREDCETTYFLFIRDQICFFLEHEGRMVGAIACVEARHLFCFDWTYCLETMFYVEQKYRSGAVRLMRAVEKECKARGIKKIVMAHTMASEKVGSFYESLGYRLYEMQYIKDVT